MTKVARMIRTEEVYHANDVVKPLNQTLSFQLYRYAFGMAPVRRFALFRPRTLRTNQQLLIGLTTFV